MSDLFTVSLSLFPGGRQKALTLSYDDGVVEDRRLVEIFNRHGLRGTFHLNSGSFDREGNVAAKEVATLYRGHEISAHSVTHPFLEELPGGAIIAEMSEDRRRLEALCGYPVRGMSFPFGTWNREVLALLPSLGIRYSRTTVKTDNFALPEDFLLWHPTIHHKHDLAATAERFINSPAWRRRLQVLYVWGHSYEFERENNWEIIENFGKQIGGRDDIWYATNIEIVDYVSALRRIEFSADRTVALNPTAAELWIHAAGKPMKLTPGSRTDLRTGESVAMEFWRG